MKYSEWKENISKCAEVLKDIRDKWEDGEKFYQIANVLSTMAGCVDSANEFLEWLKTTAEEETNGDAKILKDKAASGCIEILKHVAAEESAEKYLSEKHLQEDEMIKS